MNELIFKVEEAPEGGFVAPFSASNSELRTSSRVSPVSRVSRGYATRAYLFSGFATIAVSPQLGGPRLRLLTMKSNEYRRHAEYGQST